MRFVPWTCTFGHALCYEALVRCVPTGPSGTLLDSSYKYRDNPKYLMDLGRVVIGFLKIIPGGVLMFFPSYTVLQNCLDFWKSNKQGKLLKCHPDPF